MSMENLDSFTQAYIEAILWSSTVDPFGTCPECGEDDQVLCRWDDNNKPVCMKCSAREPNHEPPADENYTTDDLAPEALARIIADCKRFQEENSEFIACDNLKPFPHQYHQYSAHEHAGHDFWLTRCGHGAGFWDGDWKEPAATELTDTAHDFGNQDLCVGDDGKLYLSGGRV